MTRHTILFLAANPLGADRLAPDEEARVSQEELERTGHRDRLEFATRWPAQPPELVRELRELERRVVHLIGRACEPGRNETPRRDIAGERGVIDGDHQSGGRALT